MTTKTNTGGVHDFVSRPGAEYDFSLSKREEKKLKDAMTKARKRKALKERTLRQKIMSWFKK